MASGTITVRIDDSLKEELSKHCAATGETASQAVRSLLSEALLERNARTYDRAIRSAVRGELDRFLESDRVQKEFSADDFYDRLATALSYDIDELRRIAGACLFVASGVAEGTGAPLGSDGSRGPASANEWYRAAMAAGRDVGLTATLEGAAAAASGEAGTESEEDLL